MILGMSTACFFPRLITEECIDLMGKMHIENIEIFFSCMSEYRTPFVKELKKRIEDNGINVYSVHAFSIQFEPQLFSAHPRARQEAEDLYMQVLEAAAELSAEAYVFHGPPDLIRSRKLVLNYPDLAQTAGKLADTANGFGVKLAWENVHWCWYAKPDFAFEILKYPETKNLYFTLDLKQAVQSGYSPEEFIRFTKGRLVNIHVCDYIKNSEHGIYPVLPFKGELDFPALKKELADTGYDNGIVLEVYGNNYAEYDELFDNYNKVKSFFSK